VEITRRADYAVRMLIALARAPEGACLSAGQLAHSQNVPYPLARGILSELARAGLVTTRRGVGGGVVLAQPAAEVTVLSIIECIEGPVYLGLCTSDPEYCRQVDVCVMHSVWKEAEAQLRKLLAARTLAYLTGEGLSEWLVPAPAAGARLQGGEPVK
jgi:Rrf2 family protein